MGPSMTMDVAAVQILLELARRGFRGPITDHVLAELALWGCEFGVRVVCDWVEIDPGWLIAIERHAPRSMPHGPVMRLAGVKSENPAEVARGLVREAAEASGLEVDEESFDKWAAWCDEEIVSDEFYCEVCGSPQAAAEALMGRLGSLVWYRCRYCGMESSDNTAA